MTVSAISHPAAWNAAELGDPQARRVYLSERHRDALLSALHATRDMPLQSLTQADFALDPIADDVRAWVECIHRGQGFVWLADLPVDELDVDQACRLFYGLGTHFGRAASQSNDGEVIGHVVNIGGQDKRQRAYQNARRLNLHTDRCDHVGMLCLRPARSGGVSRYASALAVHNAMVERYPELLAPLYEGFKLHRFGESADGNSLSPVPIPVFSTADATPNVIYIRGYIDLAVEEGWYQLTDLQRRALDTMDELAGSPEFCIELTLGRGEATFVNNSALLHSRSAFEDYPEPERRRHLLRLWLMDPGMPAVEAVRMHKPMQGIQRIEGRGTYYTGAGPEA